MSTFDASTLKLLAGIAKPVAAALVQGIQLYPGHPHDIQWQQPDGKRGHIEVRQVEVVQPPGDTADALDGPVVELVYKLTRFGFVPDGELQAPELDEPADIDVTDPAAFLASVNLA
jgi:hypothetical protein